MHLHVGGNEVEEKKTRALKSGGPGFISFIQPGLGSSYVPGTWEGLVATVNTHSVGLFCALLCSGCVPAGRPPNCTNPHFPSL